MNGTTPTPEDRMTREIDPREERLLALMRDVGRGVIHDVDIVDGLPAIDERIRLERWEEGDGNALPSTEGTLNLLITHFLTARNEREVTPENHAGQPECVAMLRDFHEYEQAHIVALYVCNGIPWEFHVIAADGEVG